MSGEAEEEADSGGEPETGAEEAVEEKEAAPEPEPEPEVPKGPDLLLEALQREVQKTDSFVKPSVAQSMAAKPIVEARNAASFDSLLSTAGGLDETGEGWEQAEGLDGLTDSLGFYIYQLYGMAYGQTDQYRVGMRRLSGAILVVEVAWADGEIEEGERIMLEPTIEALAWSPESKDLLMNMVTYAPPEDLFSTARQVMAEAVKLDKDDQPFDPAKLAALLFDVGRLGKKKVPKKNRKVLQGIFRDVDFGDDPSVKEIKGTIKVK